MGSGHGWAGNWVKVSLELRLSLADLPEAWIASAENWAIGCVGKEAAALPDRPAGRWESLDKHVRPCQLVLAKPGNASIGQAARVRRPCGR